MKWRGNGTEQDGHDAYAKGGKFQAKRLGDAVDGGFGGGISACEKLLR